jgi:hypothetical protein
VTTAGWHLRQLEARAGEDDKTPNQRFIKGGRDLTRSTEAGDQRDASHALPPPTATGKPLLHERIRGRLREYTSNMWVQGEKALYNAACAQAEGHRTVGPMPRPQPWGSRQPGSWTLNCNQAPAYIRGPGLLEWGDRTLLLPPLDYTTLGAL